MERVTGKRSCADMDVSELESVVADMRSVISTKTETRNSNLKPRHSRKSGNPVRSVSVVSDKFLLLFISRFPLSWE
ncbi:DUF1018 domain-containing protein [Neisseria meningitidis]|nr:DUF1018 domain-containing protein [Neisseria meningitidis]